MYITFDQYRELGGTLDQPKFVRREFEARKEIDLHTFDRLINIDPVPEELKMCALELIERGYLGALDGNDIQSGGASKASVTYKDNEGKADETIRRCLSGLRVNGIPVFCMGGV